MRVEGEDDESGPRNGLDERDLGGGVFFWSGKKSEGEEEVEYEKRAPLVAVPRHGKSNRRLLFFEKKTSIGIIALLLSPFLVFFRPLPPPFLTGAWATAATISSAPATSSEMPAIHGPQRRYSRSTLGSSRSRGSERVPCFCIALPTALPPEDTTVRTTAAKAPMTRCAEGYSRRGRERERERQRESCSARIAESNNKKMCALSSVSLSRSLALSSLSLRSLSALPSRF